MRSDPATAARRRHLLGLLAGAPLVTAVAPAHAGAQIYEPLADAVRGGLAAKIADSRPPARRFDKHEERMAWVGWLDAMSARLRTRLPNDLARLDFLRALDYETTRAGLDRQMVLGLIQVESAFRKYAISSAGARGYMQVMPFWTKVIGDGDARKLFEMRSNLRYGCVILRHYVDLESGDLFHALGRYNGSRGRREYPDAVIGAWKSQWNYEPPQKIQA